MSESKLRITCILLLYVVTVVILLELIKNLKTFKGWKGTERDELSIIKELGQKYGKNEDSKIKIESKYEYSIYFEPSGRYRMYWKVDYSDRIIQIILKVNHLNSSINKKQYWFALGFSPYGKLNDADFCIISRIIPTNESQNGGRDLYEIIDSHITADGLLKADERQDWFLDDVVSIKDAAIYFSLSRKFDTCDHLHDYKLDRGTTHVMFIELNENPLRFGRNISQNGIHLKEKPHNKNSTNKIQDTENKIDKLANWYFQRVQLLKPTSAQSEQRTAVLADSSNLILDIRMDKTLIPTNSTTYWSKLIKLPEYLNEKHHIIGFEKIMPAETESYVHHLLLFHCEISSEVIPPNYEGISDAPGLPEQLKNCKKVVLAWAVGEEPVFFPNETGFAIGGLNYSLYAILEVHYNNPRLITGLHDSSGFRVYLTPKLRSFDVGYLEIGFEYNPKLMIPPRQEGFLVSGFCLSKCTQKNIPEEGIKVFGNQFHTHLHGTKMIARRIKNGVELEPLNRDDHYSPDYQEMRMFPEIITIFPGEELIVTCQYDTVNNSKSIYGGLSTAEEMCLTYLLYYPKIPLERCRSSYSTTYLNTYFSNKNVDGEYKDLNESDSTFFDDVVANYEKVILDIAADEWSAIFENAPHHVDCARSDDKQLLDEEDYELFPQVIQKPFTNFDNLSEDCSN